MPGGEAVKGGLGVPEQSPKEGLRRGPEGLATRTAAALTPQAGTLGLDHSAAAKLATSGLLWGMLESNCIYADRDKQRL